MTAVGRTTTARLAVGDRILVEVASTGVLDSTSRKFTGNNAVKIATIQQVQKELVRAGRRATTLTVFTTDLGATRPAPPSQTWGLGPAE